MRDGVEEGGKEGIDSNPFAKAKMITKGAGNEGCGKEERGER